MGPMIIFDKSALEGLSIDDSVWLEQFFLTNITPLFYVENLADLEKTDGTGRTPQQIVANLAAKAPTNGTFPNVYHQTLVINDLLGYPIEMSGRPFLHRGEPMISPDGKIGFYFEQLPEEAALQRWEKGEFLEIERSIAKDWRRGLTELDFDSTIGIVKNIVPINHHFSNLEDIYKFVDTFVDGAYEQIIELALELLDIPSQLKEKIVLRWETEGKPSLKKFAPYAAFVFKIDLLFYLAIPPSFISKDKKNNKVDLAYLYYLPFCNIFVSGDKLHARVAPLFMEHGQTFITREELKAGAREMDAYYSPFLEEISKAGLFSYTIYPPRDIDTFFGRLWDKYLPIWRKHAEAKERKNDGLPQDNELVERLNKVKEESRPYAGFVSSDEADHVTFTHRVKVQRGKWRILPEGIENQSKGDE